MGFGKGALLRFIGLSPHIILNLALVLESRDCNLKLSFQMARRVLSEPFVIREEISARTSRRSGSTSNAFRSARCLCSAARRRSNSPASARPASSSITSGRIE